MICGCYIYLAVDLLAAAEINALSILIKVQDRFHCMAAKKSHHVVKNPSGGWSVKKSGASRASSTFDTQKDAVSSAKKISQNQGTKVVVHGRDGRIRKK